jgi:hypothetical protein
VEWKTVRTRQTLRLTPRAPVVPLLRFVAKKCKVPILTIPISWNDLTIGLPLASA